MSVSRFEIKTVDDSLLLYLIPTKEYETQVEVWIRKDRQPRVVGYTDDPEIKVDVTDYQYSLPITDATTENRFKIFLSSDRLKGVGTYFLSLLTSFHNSEYWSLNIFCWVGVWKMLS